MKELCGCCEGLEKLTPLDTANRPGLDALSYRIGTHATFLETMMARLITLYWKVGDDDRIYPLRNLTTRSFDDTSLALLDAWATVADVLTFYQERIANEGYLRTATERRSILELARLVGYSLRPGVSASVFLAFDLEKGYNLVIEPGMRAQSLPGPGELPQSFETAEKLEARAAWNRLGVRMTRPQYIDSDNIDPTISKDQAIKKVYLAGTATNLKPNDPLLFRFEKDKQEPKFRKVESIEVQSVEGRTLVTLQQWPSTTTEGGVEEEKEIGLLTNVEGSASDPVPLLIKKLTMRPSLPPASPRRLEREVSAAYTKKSDIGTQMLINLTPMLKDSFYPASSSIRVASAPSQVKSVEALRVKARPFGHNAPLELDTIDESGKPHYSDWNVAGKEDVNTLDLDAQYKIRPKSWVVIERPCTYVFSWDEVPGNDEVRLKEFLTRRFGIDGKEIKKFDKDNKGTKITVSYKENSNNSSISLEHDNKKNIVILKIPGQDDYNFIAKREEGKLNIYPQENLVIDLPKIKYKTIFSKVNDVRDISRAAYGITGTVTRLTLDKEWLEKDWVSLKENNIKNVYPPPIYTIKQQTLAILRATTVYAQGETLPLAEEAIDPDKLVNGKRVNDICTQPIELDGLYDGLKSGRWLIVSGERTDVAGATGVRASELVMLSNVTQKPGVIDKDRLPLLQTGKTKEEEPLPGDKDHTFLTLAQEGLKYSYKRDTVSIYANVAKATHGETRSEILGSGDGGKAFQEFQLRQSPLTYLAASTPAGAESTLQTRVNDVLWHEADSLAGLEPTDRKYITSTDDSGKTSIVFGNGLRGSRLPSGMENVRAVYRTGIGRPGNVKAEQISQLAARPLGVKGVINPLPATGGADRESRDQARRNAPLAVLALDRLVSVQDYADFARTFAGIGKARATKLTNGRRQVVFLTIAGAEDIPIEEHSDLYQNLVSALHKYGDPHQPIRVEMRELLMLVVSANVRVHPDYLWDKVEPKIRAAMLDAFSFERRELGQDVLLSEVIGVIQAVEGVDYVDVDVLVSIPEKEFESKIKIFCWDEVPGKDGERLKEALAYRFGITWAKKATIECTDNIIKISIDNSKQLTLELNNEKTEVNLTINKKTYFFAAKTEYGKLNIYPTKEPSEKRRNLTPDEILTLVQDKNAECISRFKGPCPRIAVNLSNWNKDGILQPDQIAYLTPEVPDTLILKEAKP